MSKTRKANSIKTSTRRLNGSKTSSKSQYGKAIRKEGASGKYSKAMTVPPISKPKTKS